MTEKNNNGIVGYGYKTNDVKGRYYNPANTQEFKNKDSVDKDIIVMFYIKYNNYNIFNTVEYIQ